MYKHIVFSFISCLLTLQINTIKAQQEKGQIVINAGIGYSPSFDVAGFWPLRTIIENYDNGVSTCTSIIPNIGATIDYGLSKIFSIGIALSYQSETVWWATDSPNYPLDVSDRITRINMAIRFLYHLNKTHTYFEHYIGIRSGCNYWSDFRFNNEVDNPTGIGPAYIPRFSLSRAYNITTPFLIKPFSLAFSFQVLYGVRFYLNNYIGIQCEVGIGEPYLAEGGITFRINTHKSSPAASKPGVQEGK